MSESTSAPASPAAAAVPVAAPAGGAVAAVAPGASAGAAAASETAIAASVLTDPSGGVPGEETKPGEAVKPDAAAVDPAAPVEVKPTEFTEFTLPEGLTAENTALAEFRSEASKLGLSQEQAQALVSKVGGQIAAAQTAATQAWLTMNNDWQAEIKADKEIGGANFEPMKISVARLFDDYVGHVNTPERKALNQALLLTGAGNNPAIVRAMARIAAAHGEGGHIAGNPAKTPASTADLLYPTHNQAPGAPR